MKAVQIMFDEETLSRLAESEEVRGRSRSDVVRRAVNWYLRERERERVAEQYRKAYGDSSQLKNELDGWTEEGEWPEE